MLGKETRARPAALSPRQRSGGRRLNGIVVFLAAIAALCAACGSVMAPADAAEGAQLEAVIDTIREALNEAQTHDVPGFPPLKQVSIRLQTTVARSAGGELRFLVFSLGSKVQAESASTVELALEPPETRPAETLLPASLKEALASAINLAKVGVVKARRGTPPLAAKSVKIVLNFAVAVEGSGGGSVKLLPLGIDGTGRLSREKIHTIGLTFGQ